MQSCWLTVCPGSSDVLKFGELIEDMGCASLENANLAAEPSRSWRGIGSIGRFSDQVHMNRQIWSCFPFFFQTKPFLFCEMGIFAKSPD